MGEMPLANGLLPALSEQITPLKDWPDLVERGGDICKNIENGVKSINAWINEKRYPLKLNYCNDCGMVQLAHVVPAPDLYAQAYPFQTGSSQRMVEHFANLFREYHEFAGRVIEIGGNDSAGWIASRLTGKYLNIDPAGQGIKELFTENMAKEMEPGITTMIVACNVLGHVDDLDDFLRGVKYLLHPDGAFVFEVPYWGRTCSEAAYSQIYSEHLSYFSHLPLAIALQRNGLKIVDLNGFEVHGGSTRYTCRHGEIDSGGFNQFPFDACQQFAGRAIDSRRLLRHKLGQLKVDEERNGTIAYAASAKGSVTLNYCGIDSDWIPLVIDSTPAKQGKYMPGTHQLIVSPESINLHDYDAILCLSPNHLIEIQGKNIGYRGEWIVAHG